jgi:hypothetical protein
MSWIDDINKKLQQQREAYQEAIENGEAHKKMHKYASSQGAKSQLKNGKHNFQKLTTEERSARAKEQGVWKDPDIQRKNSQKAHKKKLETGYYETEEFKKWSSESAKSLDQPWTCKTCGKSGRGIGNFKRYGHHNKTCNETKYRKSTLKKFELLQKHLPEKFTLPQAMEIAKEIKVSQGITSSWIKDTNNTEIIHKGKNGSATDLTIYKKK